MLPQDYRDPIAGPPRLCTRFFLMRMVQCAKSVPQRGKQSLATSTQQLFFLIQKHYFKRRPATGLKGIKLSHDNARPHKSKEVKETIASMGLEELEHPPHSPDLAPCDFWLFDGLKRHLAGSVFEEDVQIERAIRLYLRDIPQEEYKKTFFKWIERLKLVIEQKGDYFEHLM